MSSILKALKKLEQEKTVRRPETLKIDSDILRGDSVQHPPSAKLIVIAILLVVCGSGATYLLLKKDRVPAAPPTVQERSIPSGERDKTAALLPESSPQSPAVPLPAVASEAITKGAPAQKTMAKAVSRTTAQLTETAKTPKPARSPAQQEPVPTAQSAPASRVPSHPQLKVNGIAYQGSDSVAVVNGVAVAVGAVIEGARVVEIQQDRVRFSMGKDVIDVLLGATN